MNNRAVAVNLLVLLAASLLPWPAGVVAGALRGGDHHDQVTATVLYAGIGLLVPVAYVALYRCLAQAPDCLTGPEAVRYCRAAARRALLSAGCYAVAALAAVFVPVAALFIFALVPAFFVAFLLLPPDRGPGTAAGGGASRARSTGRRREHDEEEGLAD